MAPKTIVLIDDDRSWTDSMATALHEAGFDVRIAGDGVEALEALAMSTPSLVILDVHLPRIHGLHILRHFRQQDRLTPVLMISSDDHVSLKERAMLEGASGFLPKPIPLEFLLRVIQRLESELSLPAD